MTNDELDRSLRQLRLGGMADALSIRSQQARAESLGPVDFISLLVHDELQRRRDRLIERRVKAAGFRDQRTLDTFDWKFNSLDRALIFDLERAFIEQHEDVLLLGKPALAKATSPKRSAWRPFTLAFAYFTARPKCSSKISF